VTPAEGYSIQGLCSIVSSSSAIRINAQLMTLLAASRAIARNSQAKIAQESNRQAGIRVLKAIHPPSQVLVFDLTELYVQAIVICCKRT
jgi:hypothetical protein